MGSPASTLLRRHFTMRARVMRDVVDAHDTTVTIKYADGTETTVTAPGDVYGHPVYMATDLHEELPCHITSMAGAGSDTRFTIQRIAALGDYVMVCALDTDLEELDRIVSVKEQGQDAELLDGVQLRVLSVREQLEKPGAALGSKPEMLEVVLQRIGRR